MQAKKLRTHEIKVPAVLLVKYFLVPFLLNKAMCYNDLR
jgi:hypothetical protein